LGVPAVELVERGNGLVAGGTPVLLVSPFAVGLAVLPDVDFVTAAPPVGDLDVGLVATLDIGATLLVALVAPVCD